MPNGKRYYWLKLQEDFFDSKRIKKLRKLAGGDTFTIIYLKMQLLAIKSEGVLRWSGLEDDFASELALDLDEKPENVAVTLQYLLSCGLAETDDNINFLLPWVIKNTGSETAAAQRMREFRERERNNVTPALRERYGEKEIEKEIERDIEADREEDNISSVSFEEEKQEKEESGPEWKQRAVESCKRLGIYREAGT